MEGGMSNEIITFHRIDLDHVPIPAESMILVRKEAPRKIRRIKAPAYVQMTNIALGISCNSRETCFQLLPADPTVWLGLRDVASWT